jgi:hypothetical protein
MLSNSLSRFSSPLNEVMEKLLTTKIKGQFHPDFQEFRLFTSSVAQQHFMLCVSGKKRFRMGNFDGSNFFRVYTCLQYENARHDSEKNLSY